MESFKFVGVNFRCLSNSYRFVGTLFRGSVGWGEVGGGGEGLKGKITLRKLILFEKSYLSLQW